MGAPEDSGGRLAAETALFAHLVCRPDETLDLAQAALLLAAPEYPGMDVGHYLHLLDELAERARGAVRAATPGGDEGAQALALASHLMKVERFSGNVTDYNDPRNSFLNEVLERRTGIPISLAVVLIEVGRRLEVPLEGVSFPGHFLVRAEALYGSGQMVYIDPFTGRGLGEADLEDLVRRMTGETRPPRESELQPASKRAILLRMLSNLRQIYRQEEDLGRLGLVQERIRMLESLPRQSQPGAKDRLLH